MSNARTRREVLSGATAVVAAAALPAHVSAVSADALFANLFKQRQLPMAPDPDDYLGVFVPGCGRACDCNWYMRADCAWFRHVRKLGDKFIVYDLDNNVIGEAEPGFKPPPDEA